jgi:hypothetical protein
MAVVKNKLTERTREFWSHVESIAEQVRRNDDNDRFACIRGDSRLPERRESSDYGTRRYDPSEPRTRD